MSFLEHLDELRRRLVVAVSAIGVGFLIAFAFIDRIFAFIMRPLQQILPAGGKLVYTEPTEAFMLQLKVAALAGLVIAAPVIMWQLWLFVAPGLYAREKRFAVPFVLFSTMSFVGGAAFSHYIVFPAAWKFFASFNNDYMQFMPKISEAFGLYSVHDAGLCRDLPDADAGACAGAHGRGDGRLPDDGIPSTRS